MQLVYVYPVTAMSTLLMLFRHDIQEHFFVKDAILNQLLLDAWRREYLFATIVIGWGIPARTQVLHIRSKLLIVTLDAPQLQNFLKFGRFS